MSLRPGQVDVNSTISAPDFRIITTLKHTLFNTQDAEPDSRTETLIRQWRDITTRLFALHTRRLREAAETCGWTDVATKLTPPASVVTVADEEEKEKPSSSSSTDKPFNIQVLVENAVAAATAAAKAGGTSSPSRGPRAGYLRDFRVRVLISHAGDVSVECTAMGEERPLSTLADAVYMALITTTTTPTATAMPRHNRRPTNTSHTVHAAQNHRAHSVQRRRGRATDPPLPLPTTPPTTREVLLFNDDGLVTEASLSAVYFLRRSGARRWVTPRSDAGGMHSVTRLYALEACWCDEDTVPVQDVQDGEVVWLSNAVRGFFPGVVRRRGNT
ncbi:hypothetical protein AYO20_01036 [Fonsecaea nubica]|uniref:Uncharacterized protein n=1 Tax=Fonsecaea nubica TaxID=856822 RepID=A0A178DBT5_9EURO|nr:hypothetical protein AYO20_01036 [Fonsecaea nubica]OAL39639.1 hypothetical protein AYO20_01036 [Fonsecaea nubica]